jgi:hypothetical protein
MLLQFFDQAGVGGENPLDLLVDRVSVRVGCHAPMVLGRVVRCRTEEAAAHSGAAALLDFEEGRERHEGRFRSSHKVHDQPPIRRRKMTSMNDEPATPSAEASTAAQTLDAGPIQPSDDVRAELVALLEADESRLGEVYRALQRGLTPREIAAELEIATPNFVWSYERTVKALLDSNLPTAPTVALGAARKFRSFLGSAELSQSTRKYLEINLRELERRANDETARVAEDKQAQEQTQAAEARQDVGIYVYALPHYLRYPFAPESGRTLMKVGRSDSDVIQRFRTQTRTTALPEEPVLLRIYRTEAIATGIVENNFHRLLAAADHSHSVTRSAGREWFVTSIKFLDEVARVLKLPVEVVNSHVLDDD